MAECSRRYSETGKNVDYQLKLRTIGLDTDPYELPKNKWSTNIEMWPEIGYPDIYMYLISTPGKYTMQSLKAYKSLDAWSYFKAGFVGELKVMRTPMDILVVCGQVKHSQRMNEPPLKPWIAAEKTGTVLTAHCTCMAGLGETCSHAAALMFSVMSVVRMRDDTPCTSLPCQWLKPTPTKKVSCSEVSSIDLTCPRTQSRKVLSEIDVKVVNEATSRKSRPCDATSKPTENELASFLDKLKHANPRAAVLSVAPKHSEGFVPMALKDGYPTPLGHLYDAENAAMMYSQLIEKCDKVFEDLKITDAQCKLVEQETKGQASSRMWHTYRCGRITASKFGAVIKSNENQPPKSLVKAICYPESAKFTTAATRWGIHQENKAKEQYTGTMSSRHANFDVAPTGLNISPHYPHLGASPDGMVSCDCCGSGCLEIKCPYLAKDKTLIELSKEKDFCLVTSSSSDATLKLNRQHNYYFQVQCQIHVTKSLYCDFCVWSPSELYIERIMPDENFERHVMKATKFFKYGVLPELLGKWFTRNAVLSLGATSDL